MNTNTNNFKESLIKYEESVFNEYISKRSKLIENIKNLQLSSLNNNQLLNFTSDVKVIIDPIKTCISNIDDYFLNNCFDNNKSIHDLSDLNTLMGIYVLFDFFGREDVSEFDSETESLETESDSE